MAIFMGRDCELSTTGIDSNNESISPWEVTQRVLTHIDAAFEPYGTRCWTRQVGWNDGWGWSDGWGYSGSRGYTGSAFSSDCLRRWAPNAHCYYADMSHVEVCTATTPLPHRYAAQCLSTLVAAERARQRAESEDPEVRLSLSAANVDALDPDISWGTHDNYTIGSELWEDLLVDPRRPARLGFVASATAATACFFGCGHLLPMTNGEFVYSLAARSHHISRIKTLPTTEAYRRGLLNARREPHGKGQERLHLIAFDFNLISAALKSSFMQCVLTAAERGYCGMQLYEPIHALRTWSWTLNCKTGEFAGASKLIDGREVTLPKYVGELASTLLAMCQRGEITDDDAPGARELLPLVVELAEHAERGDMARCAKHLDWAAKLLCLTDLSSQPGVTLGDSETRLADHDFANTDPSRGLLWRLWDEGLVDPLVTRDEVEDCLRDGPAESRDWGRGRLIQKFFNEITDVDWSMVELKQNDSTRWTPRLRVDFPELDSLCRARFQATLAAASSVEQLEKLLDDAGEQARDSDPVLNIKPQLAAPRWQETDSEIQRGPH